MNKNTPKKDLKMEGNNQRSKSTKKETQKKEDKTSNPINLIAKQ